MLFPPRSSDELTYREGAIGMRKQGQAKLKKVTRPDYQTKDLSRRKFLNQAMTISAGAAISNIFPHLKAAQDQFGSMSMDYTTTSEPISYISCAPILGRELTNPGEIHIQSFASKGIKTFDVVVLGGGPMGLSAAYNCAKAGRRVLVVERFNFFNQSGSSNDLVRMFRTMYTEPYMADLARATLDLWKELEADAAEQLIWMTGLLNFGDPDYKMGPEGNLLDPVKNLKRLGMSYRELTREQIMKEYPFRDLPKNFIGIFAPDNGCINVPLVLRSLYRLGAAYGVEFADHSCVKEMKVAEDGVTIVTEMRGEAAAVFGKKCVVTCGAYTNDVLKSVGVQLKLNIWEMVYEYYAVNPHPNGAYFPSMWFQFQEETDGDPRKSNLFYGFPVVPWGPANLSRIAVDNAVNIISDPKERRISPADNDLTITSEFVMRHCVGADGTPNYCGVCLQTNVADNNFVLDYLPEQVGPGNNNVALFTAGWGFKFVPLIGRILKELILDGKTKYDISHFKITRPGVLGAREAGVAVGRIEPSHEMSANYQAQTGPVVESFFRTQSATP